MGFGESATIKKVGIIKVDEENQMFQIKGAISNNGKKKSGNYWKDFLKGQWLLEQQACQ